MNLIINERDLRRMPEVLRHELLAFIVEDVSRLNEEFNDVEFMPSEIVGVDLRHLVGWEGYEIELNEKQAQLLWIHVLGKQLEEFKSVPYLSQWDWLLSNGPVAARVLANLSYEKELDAPTPEQLAEKSGLTEPKRLGPQIGSINKFIRRMSRNNDDRLTNISRGTGVYEVKEVTRKFLRSSAKKLATEESTKN